MRGKGPILVGLIVTEVLWLAAIGYGISVLVGSLLA